MPMSATVIYVTLPNSHIKLQRVATVVRFGSGISSDIANGHLHDWTANAASGPNMLQGSANRS